MIITVPHPSLRQVVPEITTVTDQLLLTAKELEKNLTSHSKGVGLAAVQIDQPLRMFSTYLEANGETEKNRQFRLFINPTLTQTFGQPELGGDEESTPLEGCLSIPDFYGPVPRFFKVKLAYQTLENEKLVSREEVFDDFFARVVQHELDHLNGVLFTDYSLKFDLPLYKENPKNGKLVEINSSERRIFEMI